MNINWINDVPVKSTYFPNLSWIVISWTATFFISLMLTIRLAWSSYKSFAYQKQGTVERWLAFANLVVRADSLIITLLAVLIGFFSAATRPTVVVVDIRESIVVVSFLLIAVTVLVRSIILQRIYNVTTKALQEERKNGNR